MLKAAAAAAAAVAATTAAAAAAEEPTHLLKVASFYVQKCDASSPVELDTRDDYWCTLRH